MQTILSFDIDRTLIDRNRHTHSITAPIREALLAAADSTHVAVVLNTGRDLGALREFDLEIGRVLDAFFLSGRGSRIRESLTVNKEAILPTDLLKLFCDGWARLNIPFLDIKTGTDVIKIEFEKTDLPFGLQKPQDWYRNYHPTVVSANADIEGALANMMAIRLEVPILKKYADALLKDLNSKYSCDVKLMKPHSDFIRFYGPKINNWCILQVLSPIKNSNKGVALDNFKSKFAPNCKIIHFGDSANDHNSDTLVKQIIPNSEYVNVKWEPGLEAATEAKIIQKIREHLTERRQHP